VYVFREEGWVDVLQSLALADLQNLLLNADE
jgi:hypothetical protein